MIKRLLLFICFIILFTTAGSDARMTSLFYGGQPAAAGGTDWTADANMKALYLFEDAENNGDCVAVDDPWDCCTDVDAGPCFGIGSVDSNGSNDLVVPAGSFDAPSVNTTQFQEGSQSATMQAVGADNVFNADYTTLDADFPGMGSGDGEVTIGGWIYVTALGSSNYYWNIYDKSPAQTVLALYESDAGGSLTVAALGTGGAQTHTATANISTSTWYFVAVVYSDAANELSIYLREDGESGEFNTTTADIGDLADISSNGTWWVGGFLAGGAIAGSEDAFAVINGDALTEIELDGVFTNGWDGDGW